MDMLTRQFWPLRILLLLLGLSLITPMGTAEAKKRRRSRMGRLLVDSMLDGAKLYINGKLVGKTPFDKPLRLKAGKHKLKATKPGFSTLEFEIRIRSRRTKKLMLDLVPYSGLVRFKANIKKAEVYVDGKLLGHTPLIQEVSVGDHKIQIVKEGYNDFIAEMNVKAGEKHFVEASLTLFKDFSPEVLAMQAEAERKAKEKAEMKAAALAEAERAALLTSQGPASWTNDWYKQWWIWTIAGAVVLTAVTVPLAVSGGGQSGLDDHSPTATIHLGL